MSKRDDIDLLYRPSKTLDQACSILFYADVAVSLLTVYVNGNAVSYLNIALVVIAFLYMVLSVIDDDILWFRAEDSRRKNSIQTAFKTRLDKYRTEGYYNNSIDDPELSYATNQFESIFFTKEISERMVPGAVVKMLVAVAVLIMTCRLTASTDVLLIVAQTAFSAFVIEDSIHLLIFAQRIKALYDEAYHEFITVGISTEAQKVWLRYFCVEYESIKAHYGIRLDESIYHKLNPQLSEEWRTMSEQIRILTDGGRT